MPPRSCVSCSGWTSQPASRPADLRGGPHCPSELSLSNPEAGRHKVSQAAGSSGSQRARTLLCAPGKHTHLGLGSHLLAATEVTGLCPLGHRENGRGGRHRRALPSPGCPSGCPQAWPWWHWRPRLLPLEGQAHRYGGRCHQGLLTGPGIRWAWFPPWPAIF